MRLGSLAPLMFLVTAGPALGEVRVVTESYPPFNMELNGVVVGVATDLVRAMFEEAGVPHTLDIMPWQRAYQSALGDKDTCVYSTTETPERQPLFEWIGPLVTNNWVLFARDDRDFSLSRLEDARKLSIGGYQGDATALFLERQGYNVDVAMRDDLNPAKLVNGRIDLWATGSELGFYLAQQQGIHNIKPVLTFKKVDMSLACNRQTDPAVLAALRQALKEIRKVRK
ncbi:MAG TPA: transporter substrate-binding domain-containing protein [Azospirillaceae bacterium]|nr:transporter substrate-binding domain-containing protein [Azospirillaceae bacterium]